MKIKKLFHWLYAILMFLPFGLLLYNFCGNLFNMSGQFTEITFTNFLDYIKINDFLRFSEVSNSIYFAYDYLVYDVFGIGLDFRFVIISLLTYWTSVSIIYLIFDVFMYVPLLVHRWLDKATLD